MIRYHYALNESGREVDIADVTKEYRKKHSFRCPYCGGPMVARLGESNARHFAHAEGYPDCRNSESDLHKYAKRAVRARFESTESFEIGIPQKVFCGAKECPFRIRDEYNGCFRDEVMLYDLKRWGYDTCEEEKSVNGFIADLVLSSSIKTLPPILIEIAVTHPCEDEKIRSGLRIIELPVKSDKDVIRFVEEGFFAAPPDEYGRRALSRYPRFYNFAPETQSKDTLNLRQLMVATVYPNGEVRTTMTEDGIECKNLGIARSAPGVFACAFDIPGGYIYYRDVWRFALVVALEHGFSFAGAGRISGEKKNLILEEMRRKGVVFKVFPR